MANTDCREGTRCHAHALSCAYGMLMYYHGFEKKQIHMKKNCCNPQYFQGKNCKAKFSTSLILKK